MATIITGRGGGDDTREFYREAYVQNQWGDSEYLNRVNDRAREYEDSLVGNARTFYEALPERTATVFNVPVYIKAHSCALRQSFIKGTCITYERIFILASAIIHAIEILRITPWS
jgi:hypothetical protein